MDFAGIGYQISIWLIPVVIAITFHEAAHGWMAERLGDSTARRMGRVTFNPIRHVDPFGTFILPGMLLLFGAPFLFGYAKPVPVNFARLNNPKRDMIWVALAGPAINIVLAIVSAVLLRYTAYGFADGMLSESVAHWFGENLKRSILINLVLAVFNMLPLPPLDGGRVVTGLLPNPYAWKFAQIERYGLLILIGLLFLVPFAAESLGFAFNPVAMVMLPPIEWLYRMVWTVAGLPS